MMQESLRFVTFYDLDLMDLKALGRFRCDFCRNQNHLSLRAGYYELDLFFNNQFIIQLYPLYNTQPFFFYLLNFFSPIII